MNCRLACLFAAFVIGILSSHGTASASGDESKDTTQNPATIVYSKQIAPLLRTYCVGCHSRVSSEGGVSLQAPDDILRGGEHGDLLDRQKPSDSRLLAVMLSSDDDHMPPKDEPQPTAEELDILKAWILAGAPFDTRAAMLPELPKVAPAKAGKASVFAMQIDSQHRRLMGRFRRAELQSDGGEILWSIDLPDGKVNDVVFSRDGSKALLATGTPGLSGRAVEVSLSSQKILREYAGHADILYAVAWSPDESIVATAGYDRRVRLFNSASGELLRELNGHNGAVFDLQFNADGSLLASASADATVKIWHVSTGERLDTLSQPQAEQYAVAFSPDDRFIYAAGADSRIRQWKLVSRTTPQINPIVISRFAQEGTISLMKLSADGRYLVTSSDLGTLKTWDAVSVNELSAVTLPDEMATALAIDSDARAVSYATTKERLATLELPPIPDPEPSAASDSAMTEAAAEVKAAVDVADTEPNDETGNAQSVTFPAKISGTILSATGSTDQDIYRFTARKGQAVMLEVKAGRDKSPLDSLVDVMTADGQPVLQAQLQAVRDSYFTFRGKDSDTSDDFRVFNWQEMELNEYLYADGEVVKLWLYPRGPDSGFKVYPGFGPRQTYFSTTPTTHPLQGPAFIVIPHPPEAQLKDTGLPVFPVYYENDDDPMRQWGRDSRLIFVPPADGDYLVRIRDSRGFQGTDYRYELSLRVPMPDFTVEKNANDLKIHPGTGREIGFTATRLDGYDGPIEIFAESLPKGFALSDPVEIQSEQRQAFATLIAAADAAAPSADDVAKIQFKARATINGKPIVHDLGGLKTLEVPQNPKVTVRIHTDEQHAAGLREHTPELTVYAGETIKAWLTVERKDHNGLVEFGKEDAGRNLPHGVFVDNIGLNGLMLLDGQNEREFFITTAKWVPEGSRPFYLKSSVDGGITTLPVMIHVRHRTTETNATASATLATE